jgi:integrase
VLTITPEMREGELLGQKWEDVDLPAGTFSMTRNGHVFEAQEREGVRY